MELIVIYGPPAVGKLTVAKELAKRTGYKLFHNHLTVNLVSSLFSFDHKDFWDIVDEHRVAALTKAAKADVKGVIFTNCYTTNGTGTLKILEKKLKKYHVEFRCVRLYSNRETLSKRVKLSSRREYQKIHTVKGLKKVLARADYFGTFPHPNTLSIDNTSLSPKKTTEMVMKHFHLKDKKS